MTIYQFCPDILFLWSDVLHVVLKLHYGLSISKQGTVSRTSE